MTWATVSNFELCGATSGLLENHPKTNLTCSTGEQNTPWPEPHGSNHFLRMIMEPIYWDSPSSFFDNMTGCLGWMNTVLDSRWWLQVVFWNFSPTTAKMIQSDGLFLDGLETPDTVDVGWVYWVEDLIDFDPSLIDLSDPIVILDDTGCLLGGSSLLVCS